MQCNDKQTDQWCASIKLQLQSIIASILIQSNAKSNCRYKTDWQWRSKSVSQPPLRVQTLYIIIMEKHCSHSQSQFSVRFLFFFLSENVYLFILFNIICGHGQSSDNGFYILFLLLYIKFYLFIILEKKQNMWMWMLLSFSSSYKINAIPIDKKYFYFRTTRTQLFDISAELSKYL